MAVDEGDQLGLPNVRRHRDTRLPGVVAERRDGEVREIVDDGTLGGIETIHTTTSYNPWDDLDWLVATRNDASFYSGPHFTNLVRVLDAHIDRVIAGHAGCGCDCGLSPSRGAPAIPEHP